MATKYMVMNENGETALVTDPSGWMTILYVEEEPTIQDQRAVLHAQFEWGNVQREVRFLRMWLSMLEPALGMAMDPFETRPDPQTSEALDKIHNDAWRAFDAIVKSWYGTNQEKWYAMGRTPLLAHYFGFRKRPLNARETIMYQTQIMTGVVPSVTDPRAKPIVEPATGLKWASAADLAIELDCHPQTIYNHTSRGNPKTVQGRVFIRDPDHDPNAPLPGSWDAKTPEEKEASRRLALANGFQPRN